MGEQREDEKVAGVMMGQKKQKRNIERTNSFAAVIYHHPARLKSIARGRTRVARLHLN